MEVEHVKAPRTKKEKQERTLFQRCVTEGNALFGQCRWFKGSGIIPKKRDSNETYEINKNITSVGKNDGLKLIHQKDLMTEFMKILSLAHMCVAENFTDK